MFNSAYDLAYISLQEIILDAQIQISGANKSYFLEKYERKRKSMKKQIIITKIIYAFLFSIMPLIPIITYLEATRVFIEGIFPINVLIFIETLLFSLYFVLQFVYFLSLRILNFSIIMSGDPFKYFEILPLSKKKLYRIVFYTIFRSLDIPIISMLIILPITIGIFTIINYGLMLGITIVFVCLISSGFNLLLSLSFLIILGKKINFVLNLNALNNKKSNLIRLGTMSLYIILIFGTSVLIQWVFTEIGILLSELIHFQHSYNLNLILSLIPYPFSMSYIITFVLINKEIPEFLWITSIIGFFSLIIIINILVFFAIKSLKSVYSTPSLKENNFLRANSIEYKKNIKISTKTPLKAFIFKDLLSSTRDLESFMNIIIPFIISLVYTLSYFANANLEEAPNLLFYVLYLFVILGFNPIISSILIIGLTNIEESGTTILSSLPIKPRQQAKAKLCIMLVINSIALVTPPILYISLVDFYLILFILLILPINWIMLITMFLLKIYFFGRRKYKYVIEEISPEHKILKWIVMFLLEYAAFLIFVILTWNLLYLNIIAGLTFTALVFIIFGGIFCYFLFNKMFPKKSIRTSLTTVNTIY